MIIDSQYQQPNINVIPGNGYNNGGFGDMTGGGWFWIIILFFFAMMMGWGNNGNAAGNNAIPYMMMGNPYGNAVQQGFDQAAIINGINGVQAAVNTGFSNAEISRCNQQANTLQALNGIGMSLQNCCCENRAGLADLKYTVATENCADRSALSEALQAVTVQNNANTQRILDQMCADKIDAKNEKIADLQNQLTMAQLAASQNAQTAAILANNDAQTAALEQYLAPVPRPAYVVQNPNCCGTNYYTACGCNGNG